MENTTALMTSHDKGDTGRFAVLFLAWGEKYIAEVENCIRASRYIHDYDIFLITEKDSNVSSELFEVIGVTFRNDGLLRKTEVINYLPTGYGSYLFLDSDTTVIEDISLGFEKAAEHGIALSPAPHYSLDAFYGFDKIMRAEGVTCLGQLQFNTGVIFFNNSEKVLKVFKKWETLAVEYKDIFSNDQPFFTLALELCNVNPYCLSYSFNYRGFGDGISGVVRIWHSHGDMPENINDCSSAWPPRKAIPGKVIFPARSTPKSPGR